VNCLTRKEDQEGLDRKNFKIETRSAIFQYQLEYDNLQRISEVKNDDDMFE
jgi:hypothetical protein